MESTITKRENSQLIKTDSSLKHIKISNDSSILDTSDTLKTDVKLCKDKQSILETSMSHECIKNTDMSSTQNTITLNDVKYSAEQMMEKSSKMKSLEHYKYIKPCNQNQSIGTRYYFCNMCKQILLDTNSMMNHIKAMHEKQHKIKKLYKCNICGKCFSRSDVLIRHSKEIHFTEKKFQCKTCNLKFIRKEHLQKHCIRIHSINNQNIVKINNNGSQNVITSNCNLNVTCSICQKGCSDKWSLRQHILKFHYDVKPFSCEICKMTFSLNNELQKHIKTNICINTVDYQNLFKNSTKVECSICQAQFSCKDNLKEHQLIHSNEITYQCDVCNVKYHNKEHLQEHRKLHLGTQKPAKFNCHQCAFVSNKKFIIYEHIKKVHQQETNDVNNENLLMNSVLDDVELIPISPTLSVSTNDFLEVKLEVEDSNYFDQ